MLSSPLKMKESDKEDFFSLPCFTRFSFSLRIVESNSPAVPSDSICGTSLPCMASWRRDFFRELGNWAFSSSNCSCSELYLSIIGKRFVIFTAIRFCSFIPGKGMSVFWILPCDTFTCEAAIPTVTLIRSSWIAGLLSTRTMNVGLQ